MYAAVVGMYTLKQNTNAGIAYDCAEIVFTIAERYFTKFFNILFLYAQLYHVSELLMFYTSHHADKLIWLKKCFMTTVQGMGESVR
jgi:hypothetical protein